MHALTLQRFTHTPPGRARREQCRCADSRSGVPDQSLHRGAPRDGRRPRRDPSSSSSTRHAAPPRRRARQHEWGRSSPFPPSVPQASASRRRTAVALEAARDAPANAWKRAGPRCPRRRAVAVAVRCTRRPRRPVRVRALRSLETYDGNVLSAPSGSSAPQTSSTNRPTPIPPGRTARAASSRRGSRPPTCTTESSRNTCQGPSRHRENRGASCSSTILAPGPCRHPTPVLDRRVGAGSGNHQPAA